MNENSSDLSNAVQAQKLMSVYRESEYIKTMQEINRKSSAILNDDLGYQFIANCGRDIAGELVRNFFDTSDYNITVDQLARRMLTFNYGNEFDPLGKNLQLQKKVYNYSDNEMPLKDILSEKTGFNFPQTTLDEITADNDSAQKKLFEKEEVINKSNQHTEKKYKERTMIKNGKDSYVESRKDANGNVVDEYTGKQGEYITDKNGNRRRRQEVDHVQAVATARYNSEYISENGVQKLREFYNSSDNFKMMDKIANESKGDVKVYDRKGNDITHRATPEQLTEAVCERWENTKSQATKNELIDKGYLNQDGKVPVSVRKELESNIRHSQNVESKVILQNTEYKKVAKSAGKHTGKAIGKIVAGQIIYYAAPPLIYEIRCILSNRGIGLSNALEKIVSAGKRITGYVVSHLKDIFKNITENILKKFIKSFMDILIDMVKATVEKMLKLAKNLLLSVVDSVKIIASPGATAAQKADSVFNLFGVTITSFVVEVLFSAIEKGLQIPEILLSPLQVLTTIVCTNLTMLVLQQADLFNVRVGFKINNIRNLFEEENSKYNKKIAIAENYADAVINQTLENADREVYEIEENLFKLDPYAQLARGELDKINQIFNIDIDFQET